MNIFPYNVGDDGFCVRCEQGQWKAVEKIVRGVCAMHKVPLAHVTTFGDDGGPYIEVGFKASQDELTVEAIGRDLRAGTFKLTAPTQPPTRTFMVTTKWRGAMHVHPMRTFVVESEAREYAITLTDGDPVMFETFPDRGPKKMKL